MPKRERKPHWLGRTDGGEMPTRLCYVGCSCELVENELDSNHKVEQGRRIWCEIWEYSNATPLLIDRFDCGTAQEFWQLLCPVLRRKKVNWIYARNLHRLMCVTRAYDLIDASVLQYQACCIEDPPCWFRLVMYGKTILICDTRNFGDDALPYSIAIDIAIENEPCVKGNELEFWRLGAMRECHEILAHIHSLWLTINGLGGCSWKPTVSGLAWSLYRRHFIPMTDDPWSEETDSCPGQ